MITDFGIPSWNDYFMTMAYLASTRSKDMSTKIGAVIVTPSNEVLSTGYNSFPRKVDDYFQSRQERPLKYMWFEHAERNAIYNAARIGVSVKGCTIYTNGIPCMDCARAIVQSGISTVVTDKQWDIDIPQEWTESMSNTKILFKEAGVHCITWEGNLVTVKKFKRGETLQ